MRLRLLRATFVNPVLSSKMLEADDRTVIELDEDSGRIYVTRDGRERFTPLANLVEAEAATTIAEARVLATSGQIGLLGAPFVSTVNTEQPTTEPTPRRARNRRSQSGPASS